jgi:hypothetical protein
MSKPYILPSWDKTLAKQLVIIFEVMAIPLSCLTGVTGLHQTTLQENTITAQKRPNPMTMNSEQPAKEKHTTSLQTEKGRSTR